MARVIDDPSLERPRSVKSLRLSQSTLQHVRPCSAPVSRLEELPRVSLLDYTLSRLRDMYSMSQVSRRFLSSTIIT